MPKVSYRYQGKLLTLGRLFAQLKKRPGKAKILASVVTETQQGQKVKIVFTWYHAKRKWLAVMSTRIDLPDEEIERVYVKRRDIKVYLCFSEHVIA
ncbi:MAG: hypothetical protein CSA33_01765 [Desulfobulbus propionicus]|nr:MAG: hypothetical protein CSA33_01765 [Desulfobulbus propionicus]